MYLRRGGTRPIYWHGPSLGTDFGASGSRTMFLIYNLHDPEKIYRHFSGIDGSAYLVGGVGITYLKGGDIVMAPIRSGLGLRRREPGLHPLHARGELEPVLKPYSGRVRGRFRRAPGRREVSARITT